MKSGKSLIDLAREIESQRDRKRDFIAPTDSINVVPTGDKNLPIAFQAAGETFPVRDLAFTQAAEATKIPVVYARKMADEAPALLAANLNTWFKDKPQRKLIRGLDGQARAFLSDKYQRIDNFDVATVTLEAFSNFKGLEIRSTEVTEQRLYIKASYPALTREIKSVRGTLPGRTNAKVGDLVEAGVMVSNSEVGLGAVSVRPYALFLWCLNGAVRDGAKRWNHVGAKIQGDEIGYLSDETLKAGDRFDILRIRDALKNAFEETQFDGWINKVQGTTERKIESASVTKGIEVLAEKLVFTKTESSSILAHLIEGGDLSQYGLFNAVTRTAEDAESYDRATEIEALGQRVIDLTPRDWKEVAEAA